jgi:two-component system chemotaxis sensor kinase CheA
VGAVFALDVEAVIDHEELVVKPVAPLIMASGLFAGTTLPDNGRPMLLLDASGLAAAAGAHEDLFGETAVEEEVSEQAGSGASALLFQATDGVRRAIRLDVVDRIEDVDATQIHAVGGRICVSLNDRLIDLHGLASVPADGPVKLIRISDGRESRYLAVEDVIDIFTLQPSLEPSARPDICEGMVHFEGEPIELVNAFQYFEIKMTPFMETNAKPLCFVETGGDDGWETLILQPLLSASGYHVSFDEADREAASVILSSAGAVDGVADDRTLLLRSNVHPVSEQKASIYRYDRLALISAIQAKLAGAY